MKKGGLRIAAAHLILRTSTEYSHMGSSEETKELLLEDDGNLSCTRKPTKEMHWVLSWHDELTDGGG